MTLVHSRRLHLAGDDQRNVKLSASASGVCGVYGMPAVVLVDAEVLLRLMLPDDCGSTTCGAHLGFTSLGVAGAMREGAAAQVAAGQQGQWQGPLHITRGKPVNAVRMMQSTPVPLDRAVLMHTVQ
eukprot:6203643-Pleurochrysis_carterae.AAC.3